MRTAIALVLAAFAYRDLLAPNLRRLDPDQLLGWFTLPDGIWLPLVTAGAAWLAWRRLPRFRALPESPNPALGAAIALLASAVGLVWSRLTDSDAPLALSVALAATGAACWHKRARGARTMATPLLFLLFAVPPPVRLLGEALWWIQSTSARAATALVDTTGKPILGQGIILTTPRYVFGILESCAALGILFVLTAAAVLMRERIAHRGPLSWLLVALAPGVALGLNLLRITSIILYPAANHLHHVAQWALLLLLGGGVLALVARALDRRRSVPERLPREAPRSLPAPGRAALAGVAGLALLSLVPPPPRVTTPLPLDLVRFPRERAGWVSRDVAIDPLFLGYVQFRQILSREYQREDDLVDLFVGEALPRSRGSGPFSPKTILPGFGWVPVPVAPAPPLDLPLPPTQTALVARDEERWWVAQWRFGDPGVLIESLRQLLALDRSPFGEKRLRRVVRIAAPVTDEDTAPARSAVARFARDFDAPLFGTDPGPSAARERS